MGLSSQLTSIAQIPLCSSRHVSTRHDTYDASSVASRACSNMADDEETVVLACKSLVFCALDLRQSQEQLLEKVRLHPSPRCGDVPEHMLCQSSLSRRACRAVLSDKRDTSRHNFSLCQNAWVRYSVACRLDSTRHDSTRSTCRVHAFWLCRASRTAQLDWLDTTSSTGATCNLVMITVIHLLFNPSYSLIYWCIHLYNLFQTEQIGFVCVRKNKNTCKTFKSYRCCELFYMCCEI